MVEYCKSNERFATPVGSRDGERNDPETRMHQLRNCRSAEDSCFAFILALHTLSPRMVPPLNSAMVLDVFFATMVLTMVRPLFASSESSGVFKWSEEKDFICIAYKPFLGVIEASNFSLDELCNQVRNLERHGRNTEGYDQTCSGFLCSPHEAARLLPICSSEILAEEVLKFILRVEVMWGRKMVLGHE